MTERQNNFMWLFLAGLLVLNCGTIAWAWEPTKEIEFVVHNKAGSGVDLFVRTVSLALVKNKIVNQNIKVANRPGAGGMNARRYLHSQKGNGHVLAGATETWINNPIINADDLDHTHFSPIAIIVGEPEVVVARTNDNRFKTLQDLIDLIRKNPGKIIDGGPAIGSAEWMAAKVFEKKLGLSFKYVSFQQGGNVIPAFLGGHVDFIFANPNECMEYVKAGQLRFLGIGTYERLETMPDVPTFKEQGADLGMEVIGPRGFYGPPGLSQESKNYWTDALKKVVETKEIKDYIQDAGVAKIFRYGERYLQFIDEFAKNSAPILQEAGLTKKK